MRTTATTAERPGSRLARHGTAALTDAELMAVMLGRGAGDGKGPAAAREAADLLRKQGAHVAIEQLVAIPGVGLARACSIVAAFELARRALAHAGPRLECARDVVVVANGLRAQREQRLVSMTADADGYLLRRRTVFAGNAGAAAVHPREVFGPAMLDRAACVFIAQNHPSGGLRPTRDEIEAARRIAAAGRSLGIEVRDHVIVTDRAFYSLREHGLLA
jgi:DNA repair protein RadC